DKIELGERFVFLDSVMMMARNQDIALQAFRAKNIPVDVLLQAAIDWDPAMQNTNRLYNRLASTMREADCGIRKKGQKQIDDELKSLKPRAQKEIEQIEVEVKSSKHKTRTLKKGPSSSKGSRAREIGSLPTI